MAKSLCRAPECQHQLGGAPITLTHIKYLSDIQALVPMVGVVGGEIRKQKTEKGFDVKNKTENTLMQRVSPHAHFTTFMPKPTKTENNLIDENIPYCVFRIWAIISFVGP